MAVSDIESSKLRISLLSEDFKTAKLTRTCKSFEIDLSVPLDTQTQEYQGNG